MGLDITAYSNLIVASPEISEVIRKYEYECEGDIPDEIKATGYIYVHGQVRGFEKQFAGLQANTAYLLTPQTEDLEFRAGSYGGYNTWKRELCFGVLEHSLGYTREHQQEMKDKPLIELIHFPDNEGFIGPQTAAKLFADFRACADKFKRYIVDKFGKEEAWVAEQFLSNYRNFMTACSLASENGLIQFH